MGGAVLERQESVFYSPEEQTYHNPLIQQVEYFYVYWQKEGLPKDWYDLPGTGFQINRQVDMLFRDGGEISTWLRQTERDIRGFAIEYLCEGLVFPINYQIIGNEIVDPTYGKRIEDFVSDEERNGVVKRTVVEKIKPFLLNAADRSIVVMTSPAGWSGLKEENGRPIIFTDSQTYILQKQGQRILGFTIRTDFNYSEHRELLGRLPAYGEKILKQDASVCDYVESISTIDSRIDPLEIRDVVDTMRNVRFDLSKGSLFAYKNRIWAEIYRDLERGDKLWEFEGFVEEMIKDFKSYVNLRTRLDKQGLKEALAATILRIAKFLRMSEESRILEDGDGSTAYRIHSLSDASYGSVLEDVQSLPGCAGGGNSGNNRKSLIDSLTPRFGKSKDRGYEFDQPGPCIECGGDGPTGPCGICEACVEKIEAQEE